ncbi:MAG: response regulator transcription factor [Bacteroidetes bacterium]|nr:response regulator transcription factor [Bacteroidota bacterium]
MKKIRIIVIEDNRLLRDGITAMIDGQSDLRVVASLEDNVKIDPVILEKKPDIILIDLGLQSKNSLVLVRSMKKNYPELKFIVMDLFPVQEDIFEFVKAGASGFILKNASVREFLKTIRSVFKGEKILPSNLMGSLFSQIVHEAVNGPKESVIIRSVRMTKRERQVIELVSDGLTNKEIGQKLHLSPFTVKSHVHNILEKLAMHNRIEISAYAHSDKGFTDLQDSISSMDESGI